MSLIKLLWCKVVGHKPSEDIHTKECDGCVETYNVCKRCGRETNRTTFYDCTDFTPDDLINVVNVDEKFNEKFLKEIGNRRDDFLKDELKKYENIKFEVVDINDVPTQFGDIEGQKNFEFFKNILNQNKDENIPTKK